MVVFLINYLFAQPAQLVLCDFDFLLNLQVGGLNLFLLKVKELPQLSDLFFVELAVLGFALDIFNEASARKQHHGALVLYFFFDINLHGTHARTELYDLGVKLRYLDGVLLAHLVPVVCLFVQVLPQSRCRLLLLLSLWYDPLYVDLVWFHQYTHVVFMQTSHFHLHYLYLLHVLLLVLV